MVMIRKLLILSALFCGSAFAELSVVVHPSNSASFDKSNISRIFSGKAKSFSDGQQAVPINQKEGGPVTQAFNKTVLGKSDSQIKAYWSKLVFTGKGTPPRAVDNDQAVIDLVKSNPNIIGYVDSGAVTGDVKVVATF